MTGTRIAAATRAGALLLAAALPSWPALGAEVDPFYQRLLEDGLRAHAQGDHARARAELRIAAFGLLDSPEELARALAHLALAQRAAGDLEGFEGTYGRLTELESRFGAYTAAALRADVRSALDKAAGALPATAPLAPGRPAPERGGAVVEVARADAATASRPQLCVSWTGDGRCGRAGAGEPSAAPPERPTPTPEALASYGRLDRVAMGSASEKKLRSGFEQASRLADRYPDWVEMQRLTAVLASRSGAFADAVRYYDRAGEQSDEQPLELFYLSVALFETDQVDEAATVLRRVLPTLRHNSEVRKYMKLILREESAG